MTFHKLSKNKNKYSNGAIKTITRLLSAMAQYVRVKQYA